MPLTRREIQAVFLQVTNRHTSPLSLAALDIDPHYDTPLEAAGINHFSVLKRLSAFGVATWYFLPPVMLLPWKLITAARANPRMDDCFRQLAFPLRPILPGETAAGLIYTTLDAGTKTVHVCLYATENLTAAAHRDPPTEGVHHGLVVDLTFLIPVAGLATDAAHR